MGSSLEDLCEFPEEMRIEAGKQLRKIQRGLEPDDWKPFNSVGPGTKEIRLQDDDGWFRVMYVAKFANTVHVLHSFQKKSNKTSKQDTDLAEARYKEVIQEQMQLKKAAKEAAKRGKNDGKKI